MTAAFCAGFLTGFIMIVLIVAWILPEKPAPTHKISTPDTPDDL
jgi:hypothetical protein